MKPTEAAHRVRANYEARLDAVNKQIAADYEANPKSPPDRDLTDQRWRLQGYLRGVAALIEVFEEEGF